jgi:hypothetical protein
MAERLTHHNVMSLEEMLDTEIILNQTLIDLLIKKNIITVEEMLTGIKETQKERRILINTRDSNIR